MSRFIKGVHNLRIRKSISINKCIDELGGDVGKIYKFYLTLLNLPHITNEC